MEHGFAKLARGLDAFPAILQALGVPAPHFMGWLTILVEIFGGLAVLLGALGAVGQHTDGGGSAGCHDYRASALRVQFDQAPGCGRRPARSLGRRVMKPISFTSRALRPRLGGLRTASDRRSSGKTQLMAAAQSNPTGLYPQCYPALRPAWCGAACACRALLLRGRHL